MENIEKNKIQIASRPVVEVIGVSKSFSGFKALDDINLMLKAGEIHCLSGENGCGKSTLVKIISGTYTPDSGSIVINGKSYAKTTPALSMQEGIQVIYQDLSLFNHMTVAENIAIGTIRQKGRFLIDWKQIDSIASLVLEKVGVNLNLREYIRESSVGTRQLVAICRALAMDAKVLFMDEPTTALTNKEVDRLLSIMLELKKSGLSIIFISHKLDEVFKVSDVVTVFRDGKKIGDFNRQDLNQKRLAYYMTGKEISYPKYVKSYSDKDDQPFLKLDKLSKKGMYHDISFELKKGDILGMVGLLGSGRTELALSLFGLNRPDLGQVEINGKKVLIASPSAALSKGIALLPEDRGTQGLFLERNLSENISAAIIDKLCSKLGFFNFKKERDDARFYISKLRIKTDSEFKPSGQLSGGNQQKVVLAKWLNTKPKLFILDNPTVGIDIGSKAEIYEIAQKLAGSGTAVMLLSDEIEELIYNCNRIAVMHKGKIIKILEEKDLMRKDIDRYINFMVVSGTEPHGEGIEA